MLITLSADPDATDIVAVDGGESAESCCDIVVEVVVVSPLAEDTVMLTVIILTVFGLGVVRTEALLPEFETERLGVAGGLGRDDRGSDSFVLDLDEDAGPVVVVGWARLEPSGDKLIGLKDDAGNILSLDSVRDLRIVLSELRFCMILNHFEATASI
jgi:hypothetical protein